MCGRYNLFTSAAELNRLFGVMFADDLQPRYNIAPTQTVPVVRRLDNQRRLTAMRWGLVPSWAQDIKIGYRMINARAETITEKNSFKTAFRRRRCLLPASGFYEWKKLDAKSKQPYHITLANGEPFAFAGLWESWRGPPDNPLSEPLLTCTIITTAANELLGELHDRMPVILPREHYELWLDPSFEALGPLQELLVPYAADDMQAVPVKPLVGNVKNDTPACVEEIEVAT